MRAIPPSEGFGHVVELDNQKIVTLSRYLFQHVRPMSEVIQNPGNGVPQREPRGDKVPPTAQVGVPDKQGDVEKGVTTDKRKTTDLERTASPARAGTVSKFHVVLSKSAKKQLDVSSPWMQEGMVTAATEPWLRLSRAGEAPEKKAKAGAAQKWSVSARANSNMDQERRGIPRTVCHR